VWARWLGSGGTHVILFFVSESSAYARLEGLLGHRFVDPRLIEEALTHKSFLNENSAPGRKHNERLEFLGDAVLGLCVGHLLMERFPDVREGELSMIRAQVVNETHLADVAGQLALGEWLYLGRGEEQTGGRRKPSLLADACEALLAAVYLDGGFAAAFGVVKKLFDPRFAALEQPGKSDFKTRLQERAQAALRETPRYAVVDAHGPDHEKKFVVAVIVGGKELARGEGRSKKEAEQKAAQAALTMLPEPPG
jgi:ribonuclease-3